MTFPLQPGSHYSGGGGGGGGAFIIFSIQPNGIHEKVLSLKTKKQVKNAGL